MTAGFEPDILHVLQTYSSNLMAQPHVVGVGLGLRGAERTIRVYVCCLPADDGDHALPATICGFPLQVEAVGLVSSALLPPA